jgi:uncharacterized protein
MFNQAKLVKEILSQFRINNRGVHGPSHWARVKHHGLIIGEQVGADLEVIKLFAFLHDSQRVSEYSDPEHGSRAAQYAKSLNGKFFDLKQDQMELLTLAMEGHSNGDLHLNPTIQTCWDADRLDLGRVGIKPSGEFLSATAESHIEVAYEWSVSGVKPVNILPSSRSNL